jgi:hypothetical protein
MIMSTPVKFSIPFLRMSSPATSENAVKKLHDEEELMQLTVRPFWEGEVWP